MSELAKLREAWERAEAHLHAHLPHEHRDHLTDDHRAQVSNVDTEMDDDVRGDPGRVAAAAAEARTTYDAYVAGVHQLGQGMGG